MEWWTHLWLNEGWGQRTQHTPRADSSQTSEPTPEMLTVEIPTRFCVDFLFLLVSATWMENFAVNAFFPEFKMWEQFGPKTASGKSEIARFPSQVRSAFPC